MRSSIRIVTLVFAAAVPLIHCGPATAASGRSPIVWRGHQYCLYERGWNGAGWYRCGFARKAGRGWGGPKGWAVANLEQQRGKGGPALSSGAHFERPPPTPPVSAPAIASERHVEPLRGGAAAGSPATPLR
ncbi:MAG TPA: hypothetical protein VFP60_03395 [Pseudolabrys sp.]|nr:hypothetical protein [Pseudolabrys sp.]